MPRTEAQRRANAKWDAANMATASARMKRREVDGFAALCRSAGLTVSGALSAYIRRCIKQGGIQ